LLNKGGGGGSEMSQLGKGRGWQTLQTDEKEGSDGLECASIILSYGRRQKNMISLVMGTKHQLFVLADIHNICMLTHTLLLKAAPRNQICLLIRSIEHQLFL
jgi:hypothetical protein